MRKVFLLFAVFAVCCISARAETLRYETSDGTGNTKRSLTLSTGIVKATGTNLSIVSQITAGEVSGLHSVATTGTAITITGTIPSTQVSGLHSVATTGTSDYATTSGTSVTSSTATTLQGYTPSTLPISTAAQTALDAKVSATNGTLQDVTISGATTLTGTTFVISGTDATATISATRSVSVEDHFQPPILTLTSNGASVFSLGLTDRDVPAYFWHARGDDTHPEYTISGWGINTSNDNGITTGGRNKSCLIMENGYEYANWNGTNTTGWKMDELHWTVNDSRHFQLSAWPTSGGGNGMTWCGIGAITTIDLSDTDTPPSARGEYGDFTVVHSGTTVNSYPLVKFGNSSPSRAKAYLRMGSIRNAGPSVDIWTDDDGNGVIDWGVRNWNNDRSPIRMDESGRTIISDAAYSSGWITPNSEARTAIVGPLQITGTTLPILTGSNSSSAVSFAVGQNANTGMYGSANNTVGFSAGGTLGFEISSTGIFPKGNIRPPNGSVGGPAYSWNLETSTGFYRAGTGDFRATVSGTDRVTFNSTGIVVNGTVTAGYIALSTGTTAAPSDAVNVKGYVDLVTSSGTFKLPLYQ